MIHERVFFMSDAKNNEELVELGRQARLNGDYNLAVKYYQQAADDGEIDAMCIFCQRGQGVDQSYEKAIEWYQKILDAGNVDGWYLLGSVWKTWKIMINR